MPSSQVINYPHSNSHVEIIRYRKQYKIRNSTRPDEAGIQYTRSGSTAVSPINLLLPSPSPSQTSTSKETQLLYIPRIQNPSISGQCERPDFQGIFHCPLIKGLIILNFYFPISRAGASTWAAFRRPRCFRRSGRRLFRCCAWQRQVPESSGSD